MKHASPDEYFALVVAALVLLVVLIASFMCIQLYRLRKPAPSAPESFYGTFYYTPACGSEWAGRRRGECRGVSSGVMPSIEGDRWGGGLCPGLLGVPP